MQRVCHVRSLIAEKIETIGGKVVYMGCAGQSLYGENDNGILWFTYKHGYGWGGHPRGPAGL